MSAQSIATVTNGLSLMSVAAETLGGGDADVSSPSTSITSSSEGDRRGRLDDMELDDLVSNNIPVVSNKTSAHLFKCRSSPDADARRFGEGPIDEDTEARRAASAARWRSLSTRLLIALSTLR